MNLALDLDGTLITCEPRQSAVLRSCLNRFGLEADVRSVWGAKRDGLSTEGALIASGMGEQEARNVATAWVERIEEPVWLGFDSVQVGVCEVLTAMRDSGAKLVLLTARSRPEWLHQQLVRLDLASRIDEVVVVPPRGASQHKAARLKEVRAEAFFGDTESDFRAAEAATVPFFAVCTGQRSAAALQRESCPAPSKTLAEAWGRAEASPTLSRSQNHELP